MSAEPARIGTSESRDAGIPPEPTKPAPPGLIERLVRLQTTEPWRVLAVALASVLVMGLLASRLTLKTGLGELLPRNKESVLIAEQVNKRLPAISTLTVLIEGEDNDALKRMVTALVPELRKIGEPLVGRVDAGVKETQRFFEQHRMLYAPLDLVQEVHDEILERYEYEVGRRAETLIDDDPNLAPPPLTEESIKKKLEERAGKTATDARKKYPDGYYLDEERHKIALLIRTPIESGDSARTQELKAKVREAFARLEPKKYDPAAKMSFGGNLITSAETYEQIKGDLGQVGFWGVTLVLGVVFLYFLRWRALLVMGLTVGIGAVWTFGLAYLLVGHLNSSTGFLFSIIVGNGINFGIIYMARYLEARRMAPVRESLIIAHRETWLATLTASAAATAAYGSLTITAFRGFKHFGLIGGTGMLLCWLATFAFLPAMLAVSERVKPIPAPTGGPLSRARGYYGKPAARIVERFPRLIASVSLVITIVSGYLAYRFVVSDPMEYDMRNIDNEPVEVVSEATYVGRIADVIVGRQGQDGIAIAVDDIAQVLPLKRVLEERRDAAHPHRKPFSEVVTIHSLLPQDQEKKLALAREARETLENAHKKRFMSDEDWSKVQKLIPKSSLRPIGIDDLPAQVAEPFTEKDGTRGRLVYIVPAKGRSVWDGIYLMDWADSFRTTELPDGSVVKGSGQSVIYADMIQSVVEDAPMAIGASLLATLLIVIIAFRGRWAGLWVIASVLVGLCWMVGVMTVWKSSWPWEEGGFAIEPLKLNFLNFVALPITIGMGADYAVNVMQRYLHSGGAVKMAVTETGGAVIVCSLCTMFGYLALTLSVNRAIQSFGIAAAAGEICCLLGGVLLLPACLVWLSRGRERPSLT
jgi:predicted RND superfamily exporter protein